jgi:hypothetical protein
VNNPVEAVTGKPRRNPKKGYDAKCAVTKDAECVDNVEL